MTPVLRRDDGFTMIELLLVCVISLIVFGATLTVWTSIYRSNRALEGQQDNAETARVALDRAARQLRNLANPIANPNPLLPPVATIDRAGDYDFIFQTSDPSKTWIRYCVPEGDENATLWESESPTLAITAAMRSACPGTGWVRQTAVAQGVTNQTGGIDRNVFEYECSVTAAAGCPLDDTQYAKIRNVGIDLWVDAEAGDRVSELDVATSVFLRNQNEGPTARGSWAKSATEQVLLNGAASSDPEGRTLEYFWFENAPPTAAVACTATPPNVAWQGVTFLKRFGAGTAGQTKTFYLLVRDPGCLTSLSAAITVTVPSSS